MAKNINIIILLYMINCHFSNVRRSIVLSGNPQTDVCKQVEICNGGQEAAVKDCKQCFPACHSY